jgi:hypothetical protein
MHIERFDTLCRGRPPVCVLELPELFQLLVLQATPLSQMLAPLPVCHIFRPSPRQADVSRRHLNTLIGSHDVADQLGGSS